VLLIKLVLHWWWAFLALTLLAKRYAGKMRWFQKRRIKIMLADPDSPLLTRQRLLDLAGVSKLRTTRVVIGQGQDSSTGEVVFLDGAPPDLVEDDLHLWLEETNAANAELGARASLNSVREVVSDALKDLYLIHPLNDANKRLCIAVGELIARRHGYSLVEPERLHQWFGFLSLREVAPERLVEAGYEHDEPGPQLRRV
jgi:hypothetical protein